MARATQVHITNQILNFLRFDWPRYIRAFSTPKLFLGIALFICRCLCKGFLKPCTIDNFEFIPGTKSLNTYLKPGFFLDRLKKTQGRENSSLKKITQNSSKKLKASAKFLKITTNFDPIQGENTL